MSQQHISLREILQAMSFPEEIENIAVGESHKIAQSIKLKISQQKLTIKHSVDLNEVLPKRQITREIDRRIIVDKELKEKADFIKSPVVAGEKRKAVIDGILKRRNDFIQRFESDKDKFEENIKKLKEQQMQINLIRKRNREKVKQDEDIKRQEEKRIAEEQNKETHEKRMEETKKRMEEKHAKNAQIQEEWENKYKNAKPNQVYAYEKLQQKFNENMEEIKIREETELINRKKNIQPINPKEMEEHQAKYMTEKKIKEEEREKQRRSNIVQFKQGKEKILKYHLPLEEIAAQEFKKIKQMDSEDKEMRREKANKMRRAAEILQEVHKPVVSEKKKQEMEMLINKYETRDKREVHSELESINTNEQSTPSKRYPWRKGMSRNPKKNKTETLPEIKKSVAYRDYLTEERIKNPTKQRVDDRNLLDQILEKKDMTSSEKAEKVKERVREMEIKAQRKVQLMKTDHKQANQELFREATEIYINSIRAKLSLLDCAST